MSKNPLGKEFLENSATPAFVPFWDNLSCHRVESAVSSSMPAVMPVPFWDGQRTGIAIDKELGRFPGDSPDLCLQREMKLGSPALPL
jgi:hypothetical protein